MSGLNLRLNEVRYHFDKFKQVIARYLIAQWLSGLNLRLSTCLRSTQLCGGRTTKRKLFNFYFWSTPNCAGVDRRSENYSISTSGPLPTVRGWTNEAKIIRFSTSGLLPTVRGWTNEAKIIQFSTSGPLPTVRGWTDEAKIIQFLLLVHSHLKL
ncbi:hypothetical protein [Globicatella sanguinis]